jgi:hypothetical protein
VRLKFGLKHAEQSVAASLGEALKSKDMTPPRVLVEDEQEDAAEDEAVVLEKDLSGEGEERGGGLPRPGRRGSSGQSGQ